MATPKQPPWGRSPATFRNTETRAAARQLAQQRRNSSSPLARFRTEAAAIRGGFTYRQLQASPYGRALIADTQSTIAQRQATARNQSYNYIVDVRLGKDDAGKWHYQQVTVVSPTKLNNKQAYAEASSFFDYEGKKTHYAGVDAYMVYHDSPARFPYFRVVGTYRGRILR